MTFRDILFVEQHCTWIANFASYWQFTHRCVGGTLSILKWDILHALPEAIEKHIESCRMCSIALKPRWNHMAKCTHVVQLIQRSFPWDFVTCTSCQPVLRTECPRGTEIPPRIRSWTEVQLSEGWNCTAVNPPPPPGCEVALACSDCSRTPLQIFDFLIFNIKICLSGHPNVHCRVNVHWKNFDSKQDSRDNSRDGSIFTKVK